MALCRKVLTDNQSPGYVSLSVVWKENEHGDEDGVVEPDREDGGHAEPSHGVHHKVQAELHPGCRRRKRRMRKRRWSWAVGLSVSHSTASGNRSPNSAPALVPSGGCWRHGGCRSRTETVPNPKGET